MAMQMQVMDNLRGLLLNNLFLKLISLIFAFTLWFYIAPIAPRDTLEVNYDLPLVLKNIPANMMTAGKIEDQISVRLKGRQSVIRDIYPGQLSVSIDLSSGKEGTRLYKLTPENINLPPNVEVIRIDPKTIKIEMVRLVKKEE